MNKKLELNKQNLQTTKSHFQNKYKHHNTDFVIPLELLPMAKEIQNEIDSFFYGQEETLCE